MISLLNNTKRYNPEKRSFTSKIQVDVDKLILTGHRSRKID